MIIMNGMVFDNISIMVMGLEGLNYLMVVMNWFVGKL